MNNQPTQISNELDDFVQGGIYPGGTGILKEIKYVLWDYEGKRPPDSVTAVRYTLQPTDGSNEGKEYIGYWTVGQASDYTPDHTGGFLISHTTDHARMGSNWHFVLTKFRDNCGMEKGKLSGPNGILALAGSEITLTRVDPPARDFGDQAVDGMGPAQQAGQGGNKRQGGGKVLVPTRCKFPWEGSAKGKGRAVAPTASATAPAQAAATSTPSAPPASTNGASALSKAIESVLMDAGQPVIISELPNLLTPKLTVEAGFNKVARLEGIKQAKEMGFLTALAAEHGWTIDVEEPATLSK